MQGAGLGPVAPQMENRNEQSPLAMSQDASLHNWGKGTYQQWLEFCGRTLVQMSQGGGQAFIMPTL